MNTKRMATLFTALLIVTCATTVFAAPAGRGSGGWGTGMTPRKGMGPGIPLQLKTDQETISVHLGPSWYIDRLDARIEKGDTIEVKGSRVTVAGKPAIIAAEVKKGDAALKLRDDSGIPAWAGWRR